MATLVDQLQMGQKYAVMRRSGDSFVGVVIGKGHDHVRFEVDGRGGVVVVHDDILSFEPPPRTPVLLAPSDFGAGQRRVLATALGSLLATPGSGRTTVLGRELRNVLVHLDEPDRLRVVDSCVPELLKRTDSGGLDQYEFTLNGILQAGEPKVETLLNGVLSVLRRRYNEPGGPRMELYSWAQIRAEVSSLSENDFDLAYQVINAASLGTGAGTHTGVDAMTDPSYKFRVPEDLEDVVKCANFSELHALRRRGVANVPRSAPSTSARPTAPIFSVPNFTLKEQLGSGGSGLVFRAVEDNLVIQVERAVKVVQPSPFTREQDPLPRFRSEAQALVSLRHHAVVQYVTAGTTSDRHSVPYLVMELVRGEKLQDVAPTLGFAERVALIVEVLHGLSYIHERRIYHRDVKESNIVVMADGQPVLVDFGLAYLVDDEIDDHRTRYSLGTPGYIPPEALADPKKSRSPKYDVYSAGVTLYRLFRPAIPIRDEYLPLAEVDASLAGLDAIILKAIAIEAERYSAAAQFAKDLQGWLEAGVAGSSTNSEQSAGAHVLPAVHSSSIGAVPIIESPRGRNDFSALLSGIRELQIRRDAKERIGKQRHEAREANLRQVHGALDGQVVAACMRAFKLTHETLEGTSPKLEFQYDSSPDWEAPVIGRPSGNMGLAQICGLTTETGERIIFARSSDPENPLRNSDKDVQLFGQPALHRHEPPFVLAPFWVVYSDRPNRRHGLTLLGAIAAVSEYDDPVHAQFKPMLVGARGRTTNAPETLDSSKAITEWAIHLIASALGLADIEEERSDPAEPTGAERVFYLIPWQRDGGAEFQLSDVAQKLGWSPADVHRAVQDLITEGRANVYFLNDERAVLQRADGSSARPEPAPHILEPERRATVNMVRRATKELLDRLDDYVRMLGEDDGKAANLIRTAVIRGFEQPATTLLSVWDGNEVWIRDERIRAAFEKAAAMDRMLRLSAYERNPPSKEERGRVEREIDQIVRDFRRDVRALWDALGVSLSSG